MMSKSFFNNVAVDVGRPRKKALFFFSEGFLWKGGKALYQF